jgi:hypothetical protein
MSYTIDERNPERQQLLAELLNPTTRQVLARLPAIPGAPDMWVIATREAALA